MKFMMNNRFSLARFFGYILVLFWILFALWIIRYVITEFSSFQKYAPKLIQGAGITLLLVALSVSIGALLSIPIAFARMHSAKILQRLSYGYVYFFRGTPLIAQVFLIYYGTGTFREELEVINIWWFFRDPFMCAVFTFSLNTSAYQAEILRGAIETVPKGQIEAGKTLGIPPLIIFWKITLPQAIIIALRPYGNEIVLMIKGSAIASIITIFDLMGETRRLFSRTFDYNTYILAAILYLSMVETLRIIWDKLEQKLTQHLKR